MKKAMKLLAAVLCLVLVIGAIPVQAASTDLSFKKSKKVLYLDGCKGTKANGKKAKYYSTLKVANFINNFDSKTMDIKLVSGDESVCTVSNSKAKITAVGRGTTKVTVTVRDKQERTLLKKDLTIIVKKNSDKNFEVTGVKNGTKVKAGESITVKMPRDKDDDYRRLTCDSNNVKIKKTGTYGSKYKVTFKKAGEYTLVAETYQTTTYKGTIAQKKFKVTVEGKDEPTATPTTEPTATPTTTPEPTAEPTATPTEAPTPTPEPAKLAVKQSALNTIVISGISDAANVKAEDLEIYSEPIADVKIPRTGIDSVSADGDNVVVKMYSAFDADVEFFVTYKGYEGKPASFKGATATAMDIDSFDITNNPVLTNQMVDLGIRYYNKNGVDITDGVSGLVYPSCTMVSNNISDAYNVGTTVYFLNANKSAIFEIEVNKGIDDLGKLISIKKQFTIVSYEPQPTGLIYTVKSANGVYFKKDDTQKASFTIDEINPVIEVLFVYQDAKGNVSYKTLDEEGVDTLKIADEHIIMAGVKDIAGGWGLIPNTTGATTIMFFKGDTYLGKATVTVLEAKKAAGISVVPSKQTLNVNAIAADSLVLTATIKDQYGETLKGQPITIEQTEGTKTATGIASFGTFDSEGQLTVYGTQILLNTGKQSGTIQALVKCGAYTATVSFQVADFATANTWALVSEPEQQLIQIDASIKPGDVQPQQVTLSIQGKNGQFMVNKEFIKPYFDKQPTAQLKASDFGVPSGTVLYLYTIQKDDKYLSSLPVLITDTSTELKIKAYDTGMQLEAGKYVITAYSLKVGDTNSQPALLGQRTIMVTANKPAISFKQVKETTTYLVAEDVVRDCFEFYVNGVKLDSSAVKTAEVNTGSTGSKMAKSAKIAITNTVYGDYLVDIDLTSSSIIK